jgi:hypothetical protein
MSIPNPDFVSGTTISSSEVDANNTAITNELTNSIAADGQTTPTANLKMGNFKWTGVGAGSAATDSVNLTQVQAQAYSTATDTGAADAYAIAPSPAIAAYAEGQKFSFVATNASTGASTLNVSALGTKAIEYQGAALTGAEIASGSTIKVEYDGTAFQMVSPSALLGDLTDPMTTRGDVIIRNSSNVTARLAVGGADEAILSDGTDPAWAGIVKQGKHTVWVPVGAMYTTTTSGAASVTNHETTAGRADIRYAAFDASADEHLQFDVAMPKSWNESTVTFQAQWTVNAAVTTGVAIGLQAVGTADNETIDVAFGTPIVVTDDAQGAVEESLITAESAALTIAGTNTFPSLQRFDVFRDVSDANDDMTQDMWLEGLWVFITINAGDDT